MPGRDKESYNIRSVENALLLLEILANETAKLSLAQLSDKLDMTKASLFRLMATFENHGYVERNPQTGDYQLGMSAFEISQKLLSKMELLSKARPVMSHLVRQCDEAVYLVVCRGSDVLFLDMADNSQKVKVAPLAGERFPTDRCASGKICLAFSTAPDKRFTTHATMTEELELCRQRGYCVDRNGVGEESTCVAVPIFSEGETLAGCLAMVAPSFRTAEERIHKELLPALKAAAETISAQLGFNPYAPRTKA